MLVDHDIKIFLTNGQIGASDETQKQTAIYDGREGNITNIGYDLRAKYFIKKSDDYQLSCDLLPGESAWVESTEIIQFDNSTAGRVFLKNSRIRMGLSLDAPVYQPGHKTRIYFRLTNLSDNQITLKQGERYAMLSFEQLINEPDHPYDGVFQDEQKFKNMAEYTSKYADQVQSLNHKIEDIKKVEKDIYSNVITILTIFIAIFTILNVNIGLIKENASSELFLMCNLVIIGAISFLCVLIKELTRKKDDHINHWIWIIPVICFALGFLVLLIG